MRRQLLTTILVVLHLALGCWAATTTEKQHSPGREPEDRVFVTFHNNHPYTVDVFWVNHDTDEQSLIFSLQAAESRGVNTFQGHIFLLRRKSNGGFIRTVVMFREQPDVYTMHGEIDPLQKQGMLTPRPVDMGQGHDFPNDVNAKRVVVFVNNVKYNLTVNWKSFDGEEVFQANISAGGEHPIGTYVRHQFVFRIRENGTHVRDVVVGPNDASLRASPEDQTPFHHEYRKAHRRGWLNVFPRAPVKHFMYDPLRDGYEQFAVVHANYYDNTTSEQPRRPLRLKLKTMALRPRLFLVENFLSDWECDYIVSAANNSDMLKRSTVTTKAEVIDTRTSTNMWMSWDHSDVVRHIYRRGFQLMKIPFDEATVAEQAESLQVLRYQKSQKYDPHHDWFAPFEKQYYGDAEVQLGYNRFATLFLYLNDVSDGGETVFPKKDGVTVDGDACYHKDGFRVKPRKGTAVIFYSLLPDGNVDDYALHGSCPVGQGIKWGANWWFWDPRRSVDYDFHNKQARKARGLPEEPEDDEDEQESEDNEEDDQERKGHEDL